MEKIGELSVEIQVLQAWVDRENARKLLIYKAIHLFLSSFYRFKRKFFIYSNINLSVKRVGVNIEIPLKQGNAILHLKVPNYRTNINLVASCFSRHKKINSTINIYFRLIFLLSSGLLNFKCGSQLSLPILGNSISKVVLS